MRYFKLTTSQKNAVKADPNCASVSITSNKKTSATQHLAVGALDIGVGVELSHSEARDLVSQFQLNYVADLTP
jgi:hypothetical protein